MPASVLLALLVATSLLALTPALVRRYDPDERMIADRAASDARVLAREPHRPGPEQAEGPEASGEVPAPQPVPSPESPPDRELRGGDGGESVRLVVDKSVTGEDPEMRETARLRAMRAEWWRRRHRRVLYVLIALTTFELAGVAVAGPGFWIGAALALAALGAYVYFLRSRAKLTHGGAARPARAMLTTEPDEAPEGPPTYVPEQPGAEDEYEGEERRESFLFENGTLDEHPEEPPPRPEARRPDSTGGIRGRSYESPAKLEGLCLSRPSTATS
ncbi:MAG TPA: hypothetical protein VKZ65_06480 [Glycomyces sp.]|nr:hypothetical protein [Glycomyces sp.]